MRRESDGHSEGHVLRTWCRSFAGICGLGLLAGILQAQPSLRASDIRGTNYIPNSSHATSNVSMWLSRKVSGAAFDGTLVSEELREIASHGANSIRLFGSFFAFVADPDDYVANLTCLLHACRRHDLPVTFVLWDTYGLEGAAELVEGSQESVSAKIASYVQAEIDTLRRKEPELPAGLGGVWISSPGKAYHVQHGCPSAWPPALKSYTDRYLDTVSRLFAHDFPDVFLSYDLYNEPENLLAVPGITVSGLIDLTYRLCVYSLDRIGGIHVQPRFTIGTTWLQLGIALDMVLDARAGHRLDYFSYHDYSTPEDVFANAAAARLAGAYLNRDVVCTEFYQAACQGCIWQLLYALQKHDLGGYVWSLVQDRIFVERFMELIPFLGSPEQCWLPNSGLIVPVADARRPGGYDFQPVARSKIRLFQDWARNTSLPRYVNPKISLTVASSTRAKYEYEFKVRGNEGLSAYLFVSPPASKRIGLPGVGRLVLDDHTVGIPLGLLKTSGTSTGGECAWKIRLPDTIACELWMQVLVLDTYTPATWRSAIGTAVSEVVPFSTVPEREPCAP